MTRERKNASHTPPFIIQSVNNKLGFKNTLALQEWKNNCFVSIRKKMKEKK